MCRLCITLCPFYFWSHLYEEERVDCIALIVFLMSCDCQCSVALPHGAVGLIILTYFFLSRIRLIVWPRNPVLVCLLDLILNVPINNFSVISGWVFLCRTSTKQGLMRSAQGHNTVTPVRLEPVTPRYRVKHSTTEPLRSQFWSCWCDAFSSPCSYSLTV